MSQGTLKQFKVAGVTHRKTVDITCHNLSELHILFHVTLQTDSGWLVFFLCPERACLK